MESIIPWLVFAAVGAFSGTLAGLLGVGGGIVIVPAVVFYLEAAGIAPGNVLHVALGTSLAVIVFTSISSFRAHHKRGAVDWSVVLRISGGILAGTYMGSWVAAQLSTRFLTACSSWCSSILWPCKMIMEAKPQARPPGARLGRHQPGGPGDRSHQRPGGHRWRCFERALHDLVQPAHPPGHRHLGGHRVSHRPGRGGGLHCPRLGGARPARSQPGLRLSARPGGGGGGQRAFRAPGRPPGPSPAHRAPEKNLRSLS